MPAVIESTLFDAPLPGGSVIPGSTQQNSRDDLRRGYQVALHSFHEATTYSWSLSFAPDSTGSVGTGTPFDGTSSSAALLAPEGSTQRDAKFNVDFEGAYLVRLVVDAGLPTEDTQFVRLRRLSQFADIKLVAAGERRDEKGVIPVDATPEGWSNDQNSNLQRLLTLVRRVSTSGRVLFVDANRGRDSAADVNDPDNLVWIPGADGSDIEKTGIKTRAEGYADFYSINDAIAFAVDAAARSEPPPSSDDPYFVVIQPGLYIEDLNLAAHVHLLSASTLGAGGASGIAGIDATWGSVTVRTANGGGATHTFNPLTNADGSDLLIYGLELENTANTAQPVLLQQGGTLTLLNGVVQQAGDAVDQGECIRAFSGTWSTSLQVISSFLNNLASADDERYTIRVDAPTAVLRVRDSALLAQDGAGVVFNESLWVGTSVSIEQDSSVTALRPFRGYGRSLVFDRSRLSSLGALPAISVDGFGAAPNGFGDDTLVELTRLAVGGDVEIATLPSSGTTDLVLGEVHLLNASTEISLTDAPGDLPDSFKYGALAETLAHVSDYSRLKLGPAGTPTVPAPNQLPFGNVQDVLDFLTNMALPIAGPPFHSLDTAYDGLASIDPFVLGSGLGKQILADEGAVQIIGATAPLGLANWRKDGGIQVEGVVDIGGLVSGTGTQTITDVGGSEIHLSPNNMGTGPFVGLGRFIWPNGVTTADRGFAGASIIAKATDSSPAPGPSSPYNLHLRTDGALVSGTGQLGNVFIGGGSTNGTTAVPGHVHILGGALANTGSALAPGDIWLAPGFKTADDSAGCVWFVGGGAASGSSFVTAAAAVDGGGAVAGTIYFASPTGIEGFTFTGGENATAAAALINAAGKSIRAVEAPAGTLSIASQFGPGGDILFLADTVAGALNTSLGGFSVPGDGAAFTPGVYDHKICADVPADGHIRFVGIVEATGGFLGVGGGLGDYIHIDHTDPLPYVPLDSEGIIGVDTTVAAKIIEPALSRPVGSVIIIKHELGANGIAFTPTGGETVEDLATDVIVPVGNATQTGGSIGYVKTGSDWKRIIQSRPPGSVSVGTVAGDVSFGSGTFFEVVAVELTPLFDLTVTLDITPRIGRQFVIKDKLGLATAIPVSGLVPPVTFTLPAGTDFDFVDSNPDTIVRNDGGNFITDGFLAGMTIVVSGATVGANDGTYTIAGGGVAAGTLTLIGSDTLTASANDLTAVLTYGPAFNFNDTNPDTILRRDGGSFIADGFVDGLTITVTTATNPANNGTYTIDTGGVSASLLTLIGGDTLTADTADVAASVSFGPVTTKIIIAPDGGHTIDGAATFELVSAFGAATVIKVSATEWIVA